MESTKELIHGILTEYLGILKVCAHLVLHKLTDDPTFITIQHYNDIVKELKKNKNFISILLLVKKRDVSNKILKQSFKAPNGGHRRSWKQEMPLSEIKKVKSMIICFYEPKGIVHHELAPAGQAALRLSWCIEVEIISYSSHSVRTSWRRQLGVCSTTTHRIIARQPSLNFWPKFEFIRELLPVFTLSGFLCLLSFQETSFADERRLLYWHPGHSKGMLRHHLPHADQWSEMINREMDSRANKYIKAEGDYLSRIKQFGKLKLCCPDFGKVLFTSKQTLYSKIASIYISEFRQFIFMWSISDYWFCPFACQNS